jgi:hypothetical protein
MRSYLEIESMNARHIMEVRSDYQRTNQYSETHPDALAPQYSGGLGRQHTTLSGQTYTMGKGTGHGGHGHWLPHASSTIGTFNYSNFDTAISSGAGNELDNDARNTMMTNSLYTPNTPYGVGPNAVDTSMNVLEGQFVLV